MNWPAVAIGLVAMMVLMTALWLTQRRTGDAGVVDVGWTFGVGFLALLAAAAGDGLPARRLLLAVLVGTWSLRLGVYLLRDRVLSGEEDGRYQMLREKWGDKTQPYLFGFFQAQAVLAVLLALPYFVIAETPRALGVFDVLGLVLWAVALAGESLADGQLARFRRETTNRGHTCRVGLWRYSRHPNYFFEWIHWWTYPCLAASSAFWPVTLAVPLVMLFLLFRVTGIPYTEKQALRSRGEDYRRYQRETSAFFPWFPKTEARLP
jgi:steroid 5-alpha reductase family enzyme